MQDDKEPQGNPWMKSVMIWSGILLAMLLVASMFGGAAQPAGSPLAYSEFRQKVEEGSVKDVVLSEDKVTGTLSNRSEEHTSELQSLMRTSYAVFCLKKKTIKKK